MVKHLAPPCDCTAVCSVAQLALGSILRSGGARELPCGVFGSFGWSGEAVDEMEAKLKDGGYGFAFNPIKVKFKPTTKVGPCPPATCSVRSVVSSNRESVVQPMCLFCVWMAGLPIVTALHRGDCTACVQSDSTLHTPWYALPV